RSSRSSCGLPPTHGDELWILVRGVPRHVVPRLGRASSPRPRGTQEYRHPLLVRGAGILTPCELPVPKYRVTSQERRAVPGTAPGLFHVGFGRRSVYLVSDLRRMAWDV